MDQLHPPHGIVKILKRVDIDKSPWIQLERLYYKQCESNDPDSSDYTELLEPLLIDDNGAPLNLNKNIRYWDMFSRKNTNKTSYPNSATVLAFCYKLVDNNYSFFLSIVEQYRPSVNSNTLEFPSGLCDKDEEITHCALRELKEETGYTGSLVTKSPNLPTTVLGRDNTCLVTVLVDLDFGPNVNPVQNLEPTETINSHLFHLSNLLEELKLYCSKHGCSMADNLYLFCYSLSLVPYEALVPHLVNMVLSSKK